MAHEFIVDEERAILRVRYSGTITVDERRAAAEYLLGDAVPADIHRLLLDYRSATASRSDENASRELADYMESMLGEREGARVAWLVTYDHQLDPAVERMATGRGIANRRFRNYDDAIAWLEQPGPDRTAATVVAGDAAVPGARAAAMGAATPATASAAASATFDMEIGSMLPVRARGIFEVAVLPQSPDNPPARGAALARLSLDKRYSGPLDAVGQGEMLAEGGGARRNGAYVAMERVTGKLDGHAGSFVLVHRSLMRDGEPQEWTVVVVPGSGTGDLEGLEGTLRITREQGLHYYDFEYTLPPARG